MINKIAKNILNIPGIVGIGSSSLKVFVESDQYIGAVPRVLAGRSVTPVVTGKIKAYKTIQGGLSVSNQYTWAGTLGVVHNGYIISNAHVIAMDLNDNFVNKAYILQPGRYDGGKLYDTVGCLMGYSKIEFNNLVADNNADVAIAKCSVDCDNDVVMNHKVSFTEVNVKENDEVLKYGRTTGLTRGKVISTSASIKVHYEKKWAIFHDVIAVKGIDEAFMKPGDSGSFVTKDGKFVGLGFAGSDKGYGFVIKSKYVISIYNYVVNGQMQSKKKSNGMILGALSIIPIILAVKHTKF